MRASIARLILLISVTLGLCLGSVPALGQSLCPSPYTVRRGDTLTRIARRCGTTVAALKAANGLTSDLIRTGQPLVIPGVATPVPIVPKVVIVVVDGARYAETFGDLQHRYVAHLWNELRPLGTYHTRAYNLGVTLTAPGHAAILGGVWQPIPNDGTARPTAPTLFEYYRKATGAPASDAALVSTGNASGKAAKWAYSTAEGYGPDYGAALYQVEGLDFDDAAVAALAIQTMQANHPRLMLVALPAVDEWAHTGVFADYLNAVVKSDEAIWNLWTYLQSDPFYAGQTTFIVTNDHGRQSNRGDWTQHGGNTESEQHVMLLTIGPSTPAGRRWTGLRTLRDLAPTVGRLMGFPTPLAEGKVMTEALK